MKKILALCLTVIMLLSVLTACNVTENGTNVNNDNNDENNSSNNNASSSNSDNTNTNDKPNEDNTSDVVDPCEGKHVLENAKCIVCGANFNSISEEGLWFVMNEDMAGYTLMGGQSCKVPDIVISYHNGLPVTAIADKALSFNGVVENITIGNTVKSIGTLAFYSSKVNSVTFEDNNSIEFIGDKAFANCFNLVTVDFGKNSSLETIGLEAFSWCTKLQSVEIPASLTSMGEYAFDNCTSLKNLTFEANSKLEVIPESAFAEAVIENLEIPASVKSIGRNAFEENYRLKSLTFEEGSKLETIGNAAFSGCIELAEIKIPNSVTSIVNAAFSQCQCLTSVIFENPNGWSADGTAISDSDLSNPQKAAEYLISTYKYAVWSRD